MFLKHKTTGDLVEVLDLHTMFDPSVRAVRGRYHAGEEMQDPDDFLKDELVFPSGEELPQCWRDCAYREGMRAA